MYIEVYNNISNRFFHFLKATETGNKNLNAPTSCTINIHISQEIPRTFPEFVLHLLRILSVFIWYVVNLAIF